MKTVAMATPRDKDGRPLDSWWVSANGHFYAQVAVEQSGMRRSKFGGEGELTTGMHLHRPTRKQKAAKALEDEEL